MDKEAKIKKQVQAQFGKNANAYVTSETHAKGEDLPLIIEWVQPQPEWVVLDVATGGGHVAKTLAPHCKWVVATDLTAPMLEAARAAHQKEGLRNIGYTLADAERLPFLSESFDAVCCRIAAHHFPNPAAFVEEVSRVLRPGGAFVFIDNIVPDSEEIGRFINHFEAMRDPSHVRCLSRAEWIALMEQSGLAIQLERLRKKRFSFAAWVARTSESKKQEEAVEQLLLQASEEIQKYMGVALVNGRVREHEIDEWMAACKKQA
ncbi:class I SAM-dependent methyltransferase [Brevibacillus borstelensis]|uniref:class I SAM-dependent methyltransferase n=1 Tax=Brevibacillus borstelensis TaxID=45462 RepID=UPI0030BA307C